MGPRREKAEEKIEKRKKKKGKMFIVFLVQHMMVKEHKRNFWLCLLVYLDKCFFFFLTSVLM
jgi:hypothetical protein